MREILFRGKRIDNGKWVEGNYILQNDDDPNRANYLIPYIKLRNCCNLNKYEVVPETVGQFTGLLDRNGKKIFEGDIVKVRQERCDGTGVVGYENGSFMVYVTSGNIYERTLFEYWYNDWNIEVIGNIHNDPELLEVK